MLQDLVTKFCLYISNIKNQQYSLTFFSRGEVVIGTLGPLKRETPVTAWLDVTAKKGANHTIGKIHVGYYYSTMLETRELDQKGYHKYCYKEFTENMKSGDLIAFSATGIIAAASKLKNDTEYSHLGLVVQLPNKWTQEKELYVLEVGRNNGKL